MNPPSVLSPLHQSFLRAFFSQHFGQKFFLTGGTALAEFYLHHRYSEDIGLFTLDDEAFQEVGMGLGRVAAESGGTLETRIATATFRQVFIRVSNEPALKIDLARDVGPQFGEHQRFGEIVVDSLLNVAVNKVTALFGRAVAKDFVDLYFLLKQGYRLEELLELAKEKDLGFSDFYFALMLRRVVDLKQLPRMILPVTLEELCAFFLPLAEQVMLKTKPPE